MERSRAHGETERRKRRFALLMVALFAVHASAYGLRVLRDRQLELEPRDLTVETLVAGEPLTLRALADGQPLLLVFWTTWCSFCKEQVRAGADLADRLAAGPVPARILFVNLREPVEAVAGDDAAAAVRDRVVLDRSGRVARTFEIHGVPSYVLLGSGGRALWIREGLQDDLVPQVRLALEEEAEWTRHDARRAEAPR